MTKQIQDTENFKVCEKKRNLYIKKRYLVFKKWKVRHKQFYSICFKNEIMNIFQKFSTQIKMQNFFEKTNV